MSFKYLPIDKDYISIWATGLSTALVPDVEKQFCLDNTFTIALNYCTDIEPHARMWMDWKVSEWISDRYIACPDIHLISRPKAFPKGTDIPIKEHVHYWFDEDEDGLDMNYTLWLLYQLIKKYFPEKTVILYGVDCEKDRTSLKIINGEKVREKDHLGQDLHLDNICLFTLQEKNNEPDYITNKWFNTNFESGVEAITKRTIYDIIQD